MVNSNIQEKIENTVIDWFNFGVLGRLVVTKPEDNKMDADLAVERRAKYKEKKIYFKINSSVGPAKYDDILAKDFYDDDIKSDENFFLIFLYFDEIRQKINDNIWIIPSGIFKDMAEEIKSSEGRKMLRFESPLDQKNKNRYSRFMININELGKTTLIALENGGKFIFKNDFNDEDNKINLEALKDFLSIARQNTYASDASSIDNPRLLGSKELQFQKGDYFYRDIFFVGAKNFIGQEIIYMNSKPIWGMNYFGKDIGKLETLFLKESLYKLSDKCRIGGICNYEKREYKYQDNGSGDLSDFFGKEEIFFNDRNIYNLNYRGGLL